MLISSALGTEWQLWTPNKRESENFGTFGSVQAVGPECPPHHRAQEAMSPSANQTPLVGRRRETLAAKLEAVSAMSKSVATAAPHSKGAAHASSQPGGPLSLLHDGLGGLMMSKLPQKSQLLVSESGLAATVITASRREGGCDRQPGRPHHPPW
jgi:hypothetical protein